MAEGTGSDDGGEAAGGVERAFGPHHTDVITGGGGHERPPGSDQGEDTGRIDVELVATGFDLPVFATAPDGDEGRLFVVEQHSGLIKILDLSTGEIAARPFLDVGPVSDGYEQGLLGLAFDPDYADNGLFYVNLTNAEGDTEVRRYRVSEDDPDVADPDSATLVLTIEQPRANHNGGWLDFGPDGYLYISVGDGGGGGDPDLNGQDVGTLLGKILRIDPRGDDFPDDDARNYAIPESNPFVGKPGLDEIWAYGLRNPWRPSFDRETGDLYIADVGQDSREEVNFQPADSNGGENYGWNVLEGTLVFDDSVPGQPAPDDPGLVPPIHEYEHVPAPDGGGSITGGYVYRGPGGLQGHYFFADFASAQVWTLRVVDGRAVDFANRTPQLNISEGDIDNPASFAEDAAGHLYLIDLDGDIFRIVPPESAADRDSGFLPAGGNGDDGISGGAGADMLAGHAAPDLLHGHDQTEFPDGAGRLNDLPGSDDRLSGHMGRDTLVRASGMDGIVSGGGDRFAFSPDVYRAGSSGSAAEPLDPAAFGYDTASEAGVAVAGEADPLPSAPGAEDLPNVDEILGRELTLVDLLF